MSNIDTQNDAPERDEVNAEAQSTESKRPATVVLDVPIKRSNGQDIAEVSLRRPDAGSLRGVSLLDLAHLDVNALQKILPRIATPTITAADVRQLDPADLFALGAEVASFLAQKKDLEAFQGQ